MRSHTLLFSLTVVLLVAGFAPPPSAAAYAQRSAFPAATADSSVRFIENAGQFHPDARFLARGGSTSLWLTEDALWLTVAEHLPERIDGNESQPRQVVNLRLSFPGAAPQPRLEPFGRQDARVHYYLGNDPARWRTDVPVWSGVRYVDLYPGVDLEVTGSDGRWSWGLVCRAGCATALQSVRLQVEGAETASLGGGYLHLDTAVGDVALPLLAADGAASLSHPALAGADGGTFEIAAPFASGVASQDAKAAMVDYPEEAYFATYLGGSDSEGANDVVVGGEGDIISSARQRAIYVTGWTDSTNFPTAPGGSTSLSGSSDVFVTKLRRVATYVSPEYSIYLGGSDSEAGSGIALDQDGNVYLTGATQSNDFPTTANAFDRTFNTCGDCDPINEDEDAFIAKLDDTGALVYATYLGGSYYDIPGLGKHHGYDRGNAIAVDSSGIVYVTGFARSEDFPTTPGAYDREFSNPSIGLNEDTFVVKLNPSLSGSAGLLYSTFVGGGTASRGQDIALDASGNVYVTGFADPNPVGDNYFPTTAGAYDTAINHGDSLSEAFAFKFTPSGNGSADMIYSTLLGGVARSGGLKSSDQGEGIAVDAAGMMYIVGYTSAPDFPTTSGAFDTTCGTDGDCDGNHWDNFVSKLNPAGGGQTDLLYSTYVGGDDYENYLWSGSDIALGPNEDVYITGATNSDDGFPITADAYNVTPDTAKGEAFVVRLRLQGNGVDDLVYGTYFGADYGTEMARAITVDEEGRVYVVGATASSYFPVTSRAFDKYLGGDSDAFVVRLLTPPAPDLSTSTKSVAPDEAVVGEVVTFTVQLVNSGIVSATAFFTDTLPPELILQGSPVASSGGAPSVDGQTITWSGAITSDTTVDIVYATMLTSTVEAAPAACNQAQIDDGHGNVYVRRAFVNAHEIFLPLVLRDW
jgi:uncharacterized repeat protein (TIGR01451 family)